MALYDNRAWQRRNKSVDRGGRFRRNRDVGGVVDIDLGEGGEEGGPLPVLSGPPVAVAVPGILRSLWHQRPGWCRRDVKVTCYKEQSGMLCFLCGRQVPSDIQNHPSFFIRRQPNIVHVVVSNPRTTTPQD
eukprot:9017226-Pyramimonas_sp.AAC.1